MGLAPSSARADDVLIELHFKPVPNAQIAIWLVDANGEHVQDVFVTQATGTLGIGNRPGLWDFLSSWRFPYGPRPQVLPVWAYARGKSYPALRFYDDDSGDQESLGWHENTSSVEPYFCRPLSEAENETISTDTMTCPSPAVFSTDKGRFDGDAASPYPPRNDLTEFNPDKDSDDVPMFGALNDLDAISSATPEGRRLELLTAMVPRAIAESGPLTAYLEINLEHDENGMWAFDRETDHFVDSRLSSYGVEYLGQPSVVYRVEFDPMAVGFVATDGYAGYGEWDGASGAINPPDDSISSDNGSGADRLGLCTTTEGEAFRFGVYTHGSGEAPGDGVSSDDCEGGGPVGGCTMAPLPPVTELALEPADFDRVDVEFTVPQMPVGTELRNVRLYYRTGDMPITEDNLDSAIKRVLGESSCTGVLEPGATVTCELDQLFGNFTYQIGLELEDTCSNRTTLVAATTETPRQQFQTVEGFCFIATAAWGAPWTDRVAAMRWFRDRWLRQTGFGYALVEFYYANSPALARAIAPRPWARALARGLLAPFADLARATTGPHASVISQNP
ncbi:MAG: hypothetical protein IAG13_08355 [Deltaproteobacteria bacterium]|nr:hypothetical protein [Nannocystaceae bacterium]